MYNYGYGTNALGSLTGAIIGMAVLFYILAFIIMIFIYALDAYKWVAIGKKAGVSDTWMPFIPFTNNLFKLKITENPWWWLFFLIDDGTGAIAWAITAFIVGGLLFFIHYSLTIVFVVLYLIAAICITTIYYRNLAKAFGLNPAFGLLAMPIICVAFSFVVSVTLWIIALSDLFKYRGRNIIIDGLTPPPQTQPQPAMMVGVVGKYAGANFDLSSGRDIIIGRDPSQANIIIDGPKVSRKHCSIRFDGMNYIIVDYSSNGTYKNDGSRIPQGQYTTVVRGTEIFLGDRTNVFKLQ